MIAIELYKKKIDYFFEKGYEEIQSLEFYRDIFPVGSFERTRYQSDGKPNGLLFAKANNERDKNIIELVFDYLMTIEQFQGQEDVIMSIIGYSGKHRTKKNAYHLYGFTVDLDGQEEFAKFRDTLYQMQEDVIPPATYTVLSGHGLHLYYIFNKPIGLTPKMTEAVQRVKDGLTELVWNDFTSTIKPTIENSHQKQFQSIAQGHLKIAWILGASNLCRYFAAKEFKYRQNQAHLY